MKGVIKQWLNFEKKPVVIEAIQLNKQTIKEVLVFVYGVESVTTYAIYMVRSERSILIQTLEGDMRGVFGDYIIKGIKGEFYPCKPDIFEATYEIVENDND
ncbi:hypothetical protein [Sporosarcina psychrophila]|uniref:Phage protein n=1 Tax=Sporosarcina psychrophila TaxID=1476 RepID=A0ABV2KCK5_SPOPS